MLLIMIKTENLIIFNAHKVFILVFFFFFIFNYEQTVVSAVDFSSSENLLNADTTALTVSPPQEVRAKDKINDSGNRIIISWKASIDEASGKAVGYNIYRAEKIDGTYYRLNKKKLPIKIYNFEDRRENKINGHEVKNNVTYYYKVATISSKGKDFFSKPVSATAKVTFFNKRKINTVVAVFFYLSVLLLSINAAKTGKRTYIRKLAGVDAIEEAVGRATEMGKPVMYLCGLSDLSDVSTLAAINILGGVAQKVANYQSRLILPCRDPMVMTVAQEVVKEAYLTEGRPDAYREEDIYYTTYDQFPYVAAVDGIMLREKPATNLYMGYYYAESLILAETGAATGAIQIAGTDAVTQLPFFVTACDYTLLGEELYAASAYISQNALLIGSLKGQDLMKLILGIIIVIGIFFATLHGLRPEWNILQQAMECFKPLTSG